MVTIWAPQKVGIFGDVIDVSWDPHLTIIRTGFRIESRVPNLTQLISTFLPSHETSYQLVWNETVRVYKDMISGEGWASKEEIDIPVVQKFTFKVGITRLKF